MTDYIPLPQLEDPLNLHIGQIPEVLRAYQSILSALFPEGYFENPRYPDHPAVVRWNLCEAVLNQKGHILIPEQERELPQLGEVLLDVLVLVGASEGNLDDLELGSLRHFGGEEKAKMVRTRVDKPQQFLDVMVELSVGAWHKIRSHRVRATEEKGKPDLRVNIPGYERPAVIECKRLRSATQKRMTTEVYEVNKKLKSVEEPCYGIAFFDITRPKVERSYEWAEPPKWVLGLANHVARKLRGEKNRSVHLAVLSWDDYVVATTNPQDGRAFVQLRRNALQVPHTLEEGVPEVPVDIPLFRGYGIGYGLLRRDSPPD